MLPCVENEKNAVKSQMVIKKNITESAHLPAWVYATDKSQYGAYITHLPPLKLKE